MGVVAKSYMRKGFLIYEEIRKILFSFLSGYLLRDKLMYMLKFEQ